VAWVAGREWAQRSSEVASGRKVLQMSENSRSFEAARKHVVLDLTPMMPKPHRPHGAEGPGVYHPDAKVYCPESSRLGR